MPSTLDRLVGGAVGPFVHNGSATTDPGVTNDSSQGYQPGSMWINTSGGALRLWQCRSAAVGAASWAFVGADYTNGGANPSGEVTQFGSSVVGMAEAGNIYRFVSAGTPCGGTGADIVMGIYTLSGNSFDVAGRGVGITCSGSFGLNTNSKRLKIIIGAVAPVIGSSVVGGTIIADTLGVTTNGSGWSIACNVFKYGNAGSNTQLGIHVQNQLAAAVGPLIAPVALTLTENAAIPIVITANPVTLPGDVSLNFIEITAMN